MAAILQSEKHLSMSFAKTRDVIYARATAFLGRHLNATQRFSNPAKSFFEGSDI